MLLWRSRLLPTLLLSIERRHNKPYEAIHNQRMKFKAAVLVENGRPLVIEELEAPALTYGQALVRIISSGVCGTQINEIDAAKGTDKFLPHLLGHEATAIVMERGEGVTTVKKGDSVVCHWRKGAGIQAPTPKYRSSRGVVNAGWVTTFNEYAVVSENRITPIPQNFDPELGALMGCAVTTAMGVINRDAHLGIGEAIAVFGAGGVGLSIVQMAALVSAHPVIAVDLHDDKLALARRLGATHTVNSAGADAIGEIDAITGGKGVDVAVETTGITEVIETAYQVTNAAGRTVLVGVPRKDAKHPRFYTLPLHFDKTLTGSHGGSCSPDIDIPRLIRLCEAGKLRLDGLIGRRYRLEQINEAIADMRQGRVAGRCIVNMNE